MSFLRRLIAAIPLLTLSCYLGAQSPEYLDEKDPARHALVIGNSDYANLEPLPSATRDADRIADKLGQLGFKVTKVQNLTSVRQLEDEILPPFRKAIEPGDFVVVFFSGHGFTYGPNNFLAPTQMKALIKAQDLADTAIAVENLQDYLEKRTPGLLLLLIDACRTIGGFVISAPGNSNAVAKGIAEPLRGARNVNTMVGFAARPGFVALGTAAADQLSLFSASLADRITIQDDDFGSIFKDVSVDVLQSSDGTQQPGLFDWSNTNPFLNPSSLTVERERSSWKASLESGKRQVIARFEKRNSVSRFASSARRWLEEHPEDSSTSRFTLISPAAVERAWHSDRDRVAIAPTFGGFAFDRVLPIKSSETVAMLTNSQLGMVPSGRREIQPELERLMQSFLAHRVVVATTDVGASYSSVKPMKANAMVKAGTRVSVDRFELTEAGTPVLVGKVTGDAQQIYLPLKTSWASPVSPVELGKSRSELILPPPTKGFRDVIDPEQIQARIAELKTQKKTITWVSIAISPHLDERVYDGRLARATHAAYILRRADIDERRISSLTAVDDTLGDGVRLRFFGY